MPLFSLGPNWLDRFSQVFRPDPEPEPGPQDWIERFSTALPARHPFYETPQARSMEAMGGIHPEDAGEQPDPKGGPATRGLGRGLAGFAGGLAEYASHLPGLVVPGAPPYEALQGVSTRAGQMQDALRTRYEKETPIERQMRQRLFATTAGALGESLPSMISAAAGPVGIAATGLATGGQQSREFREQGIEGARNVIPSMASGLVIGLMDRLGINPTIRGVVAPKLMRPAIQAFTEGGTEALQEIPAILSEIGAGAREGQSVLQIAEDLWSRSWRSGMMGGAVGGMVGTITPSRSEVEARNRRLLERAPPVPSIAAQAVNRALGPDYAEDTPASTLVDWESTFGEEPAVELPEARLMEDDPEAGFARFPASEIREWARTWLTTPAMRRGNYPGLHRIIGELSGRAVAAAEEIQRNADELTRMIRGIDRRKLPAGLQKRKQLREFVDKAYRGLIPNKTIEQYTPTLMGPLSALREHADRYQRDLRRLGLLNDSTAKALEQKFGMHVHRDFQARFDTDYRVLVQQQPLYRRAFELWRDEELGEAYKRTEEAYRRIDPENVPNSEQIREQVLASWREETRLDRPDGKPEIVGVVDIPVVRRIPGETDLEDNPVYDLADAPTQLRVLSSPQIEGKLQEFVLWSNRGAGVPLPGGQIEAAKNRGTLMKREERMPDLSRLLLGEVRDPVANYVGSLHQMAALVENEKFLRQLEEIGLNEFLFHKPRPGFTEMVDPTTTAIPYLEGGERRQMGLMEAVDPSAENRGLTEQKAAIAYRKGRSMATAPVGQYYTSPEVIEELRGEPGDPISELRSAAEERPGQGAAIRLWYTLAHLTRAGQTVGSVAGGNRNYLSNVFFLMGNAHNPAILLGGVLQGAADIPGLGVLRKMIPKSTQEKIKVAYQPVVEQFYNLTASPLTRGKPLDRALLLKRKRYLELGFIRLAPDIGDLRRMAAHASKIVKAAEGGEGRFNNAINLMLELYLSHDDLPKIAAFEHELSILNRAHPYPKSLGAVSVTEQEHVARLEHEAAEKVRRTMQNYEDLPRIVHAASANPFMAPFVSFSASMVRNVAQTYQLAVEEIRTDNPVIHKRGIQRFMAQTATLGATAAIGVVARYWSNTDLDDEEALRKIGYPWARNASSLPILSRKGEDITYLDLGFLDGYEKLKAPAIAMLRRIQSGEPIDEGFIDAVAETGDLLGLRYDLFTKAVLEAVSGTRLEGEEFPLPSPRGRIWEKSDAAAQRVSKAAKYLGYQLQPGVGKSAVRIYRSLQDSEQAPEILAGRRYNLGAEVVSIFGPRVVTLNLSDRLSSDAKEFVSLRASATTSVKSQTRKGKQGSGSSHARHLDELMSKIEAYKHLGMTSTKIKRLLVANKVGVKLADDMVYGRRRAAYRRLVSNLEVN